MDATDTRQLPQPWSAQFSVAARAVADAARAMGLRAPGFRSPPGPPGATRTLRRWPDGRCIVAVRAAGRPFGEVVDDLVAGVVAANGLAGHDAAIASKRLHAAVRFERRAA